jgi:purine-binding chemotaxis protein CheW
MEHMMTANSPERKPFLTFSLGTQRYAISIDEVVEVAAMVEVTKVAGMPPQVLGVVNRHGSVLPVLDLRPMFRQSTTRITSSTLFIVGVYMGRYAGLVVDEVHQVEYLSLEQVSPAKMGETYIRAIVPHGGQLVQIITLPPLLARVLPEENSEGHIAG